MSLADHVVERSDFVSLGALAQPIARHWRVALIAFCCLAGASLVAVSAMKPEYQASMKILVKRERMDPVMTSLAEAQFQARNEVSEDELNSEVELLQGGDLLERVVVASGLVAPSAQESSTPASRAAVSRAVMRLQGSLKVEAVRKTTLIGVQYRSDDPARAARVLSNLATLYVEKHLAVHRPVGAHLFFQQQTQAYREELRAAEERLAAFGRDERVVSPLAERDSALQTLAEFEAALRRTEAAIAESDQRMQVLHGQVATTPSRQTTEVRTAKDGDRLRDLKARLLDLQLKQADMFRKFTPDYPPLRQVAESIEQTEAALRDAVESPVTAETTNQNPTHQWLRDEQVRVATDRHGLVGRAQALGRAIGEYRAKARRLDEARIRQDGLLTAVHTARAAHELYQRKQEEARISDALDKTRIANVSLAEEPIVPAFPSNARRLKVLMLGLVASFVASVGLAYLLYVLMPTIRTPDDVRTFLNVPVLAVLPAGLR